MVKCNASELISKTVFMGKGGIYMADSIQQHCKHLSLAGLELGICGVADSSD